MVVPAIEVVITNIGDHPIDDESTESGQTWLKAFLQGATTIPGGNFASWGRSYKYPDTAVHFIDYDSSKQYYDHKEEVIRVTGSNPTPVPINTIQDPHRTDMYIIHPNTTDRRVFYAPQTNVVFFWGIDEDKFTKLAPEFFSAISKSDACLGYIWGEVQARSMSDTSGNLKLGRGGIMISGWRSREEHDRDVTKPRVVDAYAAVSTASTKTDTWGMQVTVVEANGYVHKWRRLAAVDRTKHLVAAGNH